MNTKVLIIDDDINICELVRMYIEKEGYTALIAHNSIKAMELFTKHAPNLILLDIMLPGIDGMQLCRNIRSISNTPIIMLTAKGETYDKVSALEIGADDYIVKPFDSKELMARLKAVLRRSAEHDDAATPILTFDNLVINLANYTLQIKKKAYTLPPKELELLYYLANNANKVFTREKLLTEVWGYDYYGDSRTVDVHIRRLRARIQNISNKWELQTVWGVGYKFETIDETNS